MGEAADHETQVAPGIRGLTTAEAYGVVFDLPALPQSDDADLDRIPMGPVAPGAGSAPGCAPRCLRSHSEVGRLPF